MVNELRQNLARRQDLVVIADLIPPKVRVLDLGCGDGTLLRLLKEEKEVHGLGLELSESKILESTNNGIPVVNKNLNDGLREFSDQSFDFVVLSQTLQAVQRPDNLLEEMVRVGNKVVISFINIGYIRARLQLAFKGRMPETKTLPDHWYDTPNIHLGTILDFRSLCLARGIRVLQEVPLGFRSNILAQCWPNMFAPTCVFVVSKA